MSRPIYDDLLKRVLAVIGEIVHPGLLWGPCHPAYVRQHIAQDVSSLLFLAPHADARAVAARAAGMLSSEGVELPAPDPDRFAFTHPSNRGTT